MKKTMGKIRCIMMYTGNQCIQAERVNNGWYVWKAAIVISEEDLIHELELMDKWEVVASD